MDVAIVLSTISMMAIIILFGVIIGYKYQITLESRKLLMLIILNIAVPSVILNGVFNTEIDNNLLSNVIAIFLISIIFNLAGIGVGWMSAILFGFRTDKAKKIAILAGLGNTGFIGIPLCATLFGPVGGLLAAIYDAGMNVVAYTLALFLLQQGKFSLKNLKEGINPPMIAIIVGMSIAIIGYQPPVIVKDLSGILAGITAPLAMLYVGILIPSFFREKKKVEVRFVSIPLSLKLILIPVLLIVVTQFLPISTEIKQIIFIQVSMPTFMMATILFARYAKDEESAVLTTIYSTLFSLLTIPLISYLSRFLS